MHHVKLKGKRGPQLPSVTSVSPSAVVWGTGRPEASEGLWGLQGPAMLSPRVKCGAAHCVICSTPSDEVRPGLLAVCEGLWLFSFCPSPMGFGR